MVKTGIQEVALLRDVQARFLGDSPITKRLAEARGIFPGGSCSLTLEAGSRPRRECPSATAGPGGERLLGRSRLQFGRPGEIPGRRGAQRGSHSHHRGFDREGRQRRRTRPGKFIPHGRGEQRDVHSGQHAHPQDQQALDFVSGAVNWLLSREQLIGIAPKIPQTLTFSLDENALRNLRWFILVLMPLIPAVIGFAVWWRRRAETRVTVDRRACLAFVSQDILSLAQYKLGQSEATSLRGE